MITERDPRVIVAKQLFLRKYNPQGKRETALDKAIIVSLARNDSYAENAKEWQRGMVKDYWGKLLVELSEKYATAEQTQAVFDQDILLLKDKMNTSYGEIFQGSNFKISHAQKSLSVYLKQLWCMRLSTIPPRCPVDRIILQMAGAPQNMMPWTRVDDIVDYRRHCNLLEQKRKLDKFEKIACWELVKFSPDNQI